MASSKTKTKSANSQHAKDSVIAVDWGDAFIKSMVGHYEKDDLCVRECQMLPRTGMGFSWEGSGRKENYGYDIKSLIANTKPDTQTFISTTVMEKFKVVIAGITNDAVRLALRFCRHAGVDVIGVISLQKEIVQRDVNAFTQADAAILVSEGKRDHRFDIATLAKQLAENLDRSVASSNIPVIFAGSDELQQDVKAYFAPSHPFLKVGYLHPTKQNHNFLPLLYELEQLRVRSEQLRGSELSALASNSKQLIRSGNLAALSAAGVLTLELGSNVLVVDIGSSHTTAFWSMVTDDWMIKDSDDEESFLQFSIQPQRDQSERFGFSIMPEVGIGSAASRFARDLIKSGKLSRLPADDVDRISSWDRLGNQMLHPGTIPEGTDLKLQYTLARAILERILSQLPDGYEPRHIILSGGIFRNSTHAEKIVRDILVPVGLPWMCSLWGVGYPSLSMIGSLFWHGIDRLGSILNTSIYKIGEYVPIVGRAKRSKDKAAISVDAHSRDVTRYGVKHGEINMIPLDLDHLAMVRLLPDMKSKVPGYDFGEEVLIRSDGGKVGLIMDGR